MKFTFKICLIFVFNTLFAQSNWPGNSWYGATNLTSIMNANGVTAASGLHWNDATKRLYLVQDTGRLRVLEFNETLNSFTQIGNLAVSGDLEGITQVQSSANEFYVIVENDYTIRRYTHNSNFTSATLVNSWNLLQAPSPMVNTANDGPEGIAFVSDAFLTTSGFVSSQTGQPYTSTKGMGGLLFIAHQNGGYVWVFDINPNQTNDFLYVGKYKTNRNESCDLSFDASTGLLYILHNTGDNFLEVTDLSSSIQNNDYVFTKIQEFALPFAMDNDNIEGFAMMPKCPNENQVSAWLCRDTSNSDGNSVTTDVLRWFQNFGAPGNCEPLSNENLDINSIFTYPIPTSDFINFNSTENLQVLGVYDMSGQFYKTQIVATGIDMRLFSSGVYWLIVVKDNQVNHIKVVKL